MAGRNQKTGRGKQAKHATPRKVGDTRYATHEEQLLELLAHIRQRDQRVQRALLVLLSSGASAEVFAAIGEIVTFAVWQAVRRGEERHRVRRMADSGTAGGAP